MYKHICLENINTLYKSSGKCNYKLHFKDNIESWMVSNTERFTDNSPITPGTPIIVKKRSARKSLRLFTEVLDVKNKTTVRRIGAAK